MSMPRRSTASVGIVYGSGLLQGLTLVSFPASSAVLRQMHGLTDAQYGAIFLPQVALAILGAVCGGVLARGLGLRRLLWIALLFNALSQLALAGSTLLSQTAAYIAILVGTASIGLGFGLSGAPLNSYPPMYFPVQRSTAVVALHSLIGVGLMVGPLGVNAFSGAGYWVGFPLLLLATCLALAVAAAVTPLGDHVETTSSNAVMPDPDRPIVSVSFWLFVMMAVLYAFAEGTFSNWAVVYLQEAKQLPATVAALALSVFWGALVAGRLLTSALVLKISAQVIWILLPILMIVTFLLLPYAGSAVLGIGLFALAGLACSSFFPLSIAIISNRFPQHVAFVSSMMIAALMVGVGLGSYVVGALREMFPLEQLYRLSSGYPLLVFTLAGYLILNGSLRPALQK